MRLLTLAYHVALALAAAPGWSTCGGLPDRYNHTACPSDVSTCCKQAWVPGDGHWGCCPYPDAVCCGEHTCCPHGSTCRNQGRSSFVTTTCVAANGTESPAGAVGGGEQVCKTGAPLPLSTRKKNVIILGDSVSIGYAPRVLSHLSDIALVQHSPWDVADGGAEETRYGWLCLDHMLSAPDGAPQRPDVLYWNFGLHNYMDRNIPGQEGPVAQYAPYLEKVAQKLAGLRVQGVKLLFGLTTPMMCNKTADDTVMSNNRDAIAVMRRYNIPTVDMHAAITSQCGSAPNATCFGFDGCFCPHCSDVGYEFLAANVIAPAIRRLLSSDGLII